MTRAQFAVTLAVVVVAGMVGGALSGYIRPQSALAQDDGPRQPGPWQLVPLAEYPKAYVMDTVTGEVYLLNYKDPDPWTYCGLPMGHRPP
jgi:hypothetical protein